MHFNDCNAIENHNKIQKYDLALEKYWVTQSGHFRLATTLALGEGITDENIIFYHCISEKIKDREIATR